MKEVPSFIVGSGSAARAMSAALGIVQSPQSPVRVLPPRQLKRGETLPPVSSTSLLIIANPHALHAPMILEAERKGFTHIVCEKPAVISRDAIAALRSVRAEVIVCHGYRQNWGPQRIRQAIARKEIGDLISLEGRYWQSSAAAWAVEGRQKREGWKNHPELSGPFDTLMDLGTHWADLVTFLAGEKPALARTRLSYFNAEAAHRDTHVHLELDFPSGLHAWGSVSKTVHGSGNHLEVVAIGTDGMLKWNFERPDELVQGRGRDVRIFSRSNDEKVASGLPAHHALGWLEGYASLFYEMLLRLDGKQGIGAPSLSESLDTADLLLAAAAADERRRAPDLSRL
ncbi:hypothetical protein K2X33_11450 [bacterium]|nr:hypothetical protein [bacterium]